MTCSTLTSMWLLSALLALSIQVTSPITVAVIDTGIDLDHPHFAGVPIEAVDFTTEYSTEGMTDVCIHGTPVAGLVVDQNPQVALLVIKASISCWGDYGAIIDGIYYAVEQGARVITISMLGQGDYPPLHDALIFARDSGVFVTVSAGNYGGDNIPRYPAWYPEVAAVSAYDYAYSSYGKFVDLSAPGYSIKAPAGGNTYIYVTGTSASAPIVAGMASYIWARQPELSLAEMEAVLYASLVDIEPLGVDDRTGFGRVDERRLRESLGTLYLSVPWLTTGKVGVPSARLESAVVLDDIEIVYR